VDLLAVALFVSLARRATLEQHTKLDFCGSGWVYGFTLLKNLTCGIKTSNPI
jgi:hypothetical protein